MFTSISATSLKINEINTEEFSTKLLPIDDWSGEFSGEIGHPDPDSEDPKIVGTITGNFKIGNRGGYFEGNVRSIDDGGSGTFKGIFSRNILIGRVTGEKGSIPIVGFLGFRQEEYVFGGRFMSTIGPALYFKGTYLLF